MSGMRLCLHVGCGFDLVVRMGVGGLVAAHWVPRNPQRCRGHSTAAASADTAGSMASGGNAVDMCH